MNTLDSAVTTTTPGVQLALATEHGELLAAPTNYAEWQATKFTALQLADASCSGPAADPDHDGVPNLFVYLYNRQPRLPESGALPTVQILDGYLTIKYPVLRSITDLTVYVEVAESLAGPWHSGPAFVQETAEDPDPTGPTYTAIARDKVVARPPNNALRA